jgi:hypothetical protein
MQLTESYCMVQNCDFVRRGVYLYAIGVEKEYVQKAMFFCCHWKQAPPLIPLLANVGKGTAYRQQRTEILRKRKGGSQYGCVS